MRAKTAGRALDLAQYMDSTLAGLDFSKLVKEGQRLCFKAIFRDILNRDVDSLCA